MTCEGKLAGLGAEGIAGGADDVADVVVLERGEQLLAERVLFQVQLHAPLAVLHLDEGGLAEGAARQDPAGNHECLRVLLYDLLRAVGGRKSAEVWLGLKSFGYGFIPASQSASTLRLLCNNSSLNSSM